MEIEAAIALATGTFGLGVISGVGVSRWLSRKRKPATVHAVQQELRRRMRAGQ